MEHLFKQLAREALTKVNSKVNDNCDPYGAYSAEVTAEFGEIRDPFVLEEFTATADYNCGAETSVVVTDENGFVVYREEY